ncbi:MAG: hypothetical protein KDJ36_10885 [Hyphomicrobiaceae bacterium]|nr:hypothetical protein [Hyphomicrobiaceae bacterium]
MSRPIACLFATAGLAVLTVNTGNNLTEINRVTFAWDTTGVIIALAATSALLSFFFGRIWRLSRAAGLAALLIIGGCMTTSVLLTTDRIGAVEEEGKDAGRDRNGRIRRLDQDIARLSEKADAQRPVAARECRGYRDGSSDPKRWPICLTARALMADYETTLGETRDTRRHSEKVLGWAFGPRAGHTIAMTRPVLVALLLEFGTSLLLTVAGLFAPRGRRPEPVVIDEGRMIDITPSVMDPALVAVLTDARRRQRALTNDDVAEALGVHKSVASLRVSRLVTAGLVRRDRIGRQVAITLAN